MLPSSSPFLDQFIYASASAVTSDPPSPVNSPSLQDLANDGDLQILVRKDNITSVIKVVAGVMKVNSPVWKMLISRHNHHKFDKTTVQENEVQDVVEAQEVEAQQQTEVPEDTEVDEEQEFKKKRSLKSIAKLMMGAQPRISNWMKIHLW
jgi:hypothetical protein